VYTSGPRIPGWLTPVMVISLIILLVTFSRPKPLPRIAPPSAVTNTAGFGGFEQIPPTAGPQATPQAITGDFSQINQLDLVIAEDIFASPEQAVVASELDSALAYVSDRFGTIAQGRIKTVLANEASCGLHGIAYTDIREVQVFTCASLPRQRAINILAHEFVHQLSHDRYGSRHLSADLILLEGVATWGAGQYWLGNYDSFRAMVQPYKQNGTLLPLAMSYVGQGINVMNQLYYQWASFVEFLIETYGRERFDALYISGSGSPGSADYRGVYGKDLGTLEAEWQLWLDRP
jgi:S-adenosylmethionine/arginine decarboxylase-like enzyme